MVTDKYGRKKPAYEDLLFYQNICKLREMIYDITERFYKSHPRLVGQMRDAARSAKQNIREGYKRDSTGEFARGIKISKGSLEELEGDVDDCHRDRLIYDSEYDMLKKLFSSIDHLSNRYLDSLAKMEKEGSWKQRFKK